MKDKVLRLLLTGLLLGSAFMAGHLARTFLNPVKADLPTVDQDTRFGAIVRLVRDNRTFCTGTVVGPNLIITAAHCVVMESPFGIAFMPTEIEIRPSENVRTNTIAKIVYASVQMDQAMLTGDFRRYQAKRIITDPAVLAQTAVKDAHFLSCGYPLNGDLFCNVTIFDKNDNFFWAVNGVLIPGMSGGPTMRADGTLVAVNVAVQGANSIVSPIYNITKNLAGSK